MSGDYASDHEHELTPEYLYPNDADVLDIYEQDGELYVAVAVLCPECSETLSLTAPVTSVTETDAELPFDDSFYE